MLQCTGVGLLQICMNYRIFTGVIARTQACCKPVLQSISEQWGLHFALNTAALHLCWVTARLFEEQISIGVTAVPHCLL